MTELTKEQRIAKHKSFLNANGLLIAAFAWEHYLTKGRGAVLVPEADFLRADTPQLKGIRFHYLAETERAHPSFNDVLAEKELAWMESYDPDEKVIVCVLREGGGISSYLVGGRMKNSAAYERQKNAMCN
jgi:hypothetical protein